MSNPYRDAGDEIERTWRERANGIRPRPSNVCLGEQPRPIGLPKPPVDTAAQAAFAESELQDRIRHARLLRVLLVSAVFVAAVVGVALAIVKWMP